MQIAFFGLMSCPTPADFIHPRGVYRFTRASGPLSLTEQDSHLTIRNFANESVWLSGATLLPALTWTRFGGSCAW